jgi:hypothetical protein
MADIGRSSFIPKETAGLTPSSMRRKRTFHVFGFLSTALLVGSLVLTVGVYFLERSAVNQLASAKEELAKQKVLFNPSSIDELRAFDHRLHAAETLMGQHIAPLKVFAALESATKQKIQFTSFSLTRQPGQEIFLSLGGLTKEFKSLALQELQFGETQVLKDVIFKEVSLGGEGEETTVASADERNVTFSLEGTLDPALIKYDGSPVFAAPTAFIETDGSLAVGEGDAAVLGEAITLEDI